MQDDYLNGAGAWPGAYGGPSPIGGGASVTTMPMIGSSQGPGIASLPVSGAGVPMSAASKPARNVVFITWAIVLVLLVLSHTFTFELQE